MEEIEKLCACGFNPFDLNDQCYCPYVPDNIPRRVYPIIEEESVQAFSAYLDELGLLTPG